MLIAHNQRQFPASTRCTPRSMPFVGRAVCELSRIVIMLARVGLQAQTYAATRTRGRAQEHDYRARRS